jgi:hypothetical protein
MRSTRKSENLGLSCVMSVIFMCGCWLIHIFCSSFFLGSFKKKKMLRDMCTYLCIMGLLYGSLSMHFNYSLLNDCLYVKKIYTLPRKMCCMYIYIYIYIFNTHIFLYTQ